MLEKFLNYEIVINCRTETEARIFVDVMANMGYRWRGGEPMTKLFYDRHRHLTCYGYARGLVFTNIDYYDFTDIAIIRFEDFMNESYVVSNKHKEV